MNRSSSADTFQMHFLALLRQLPESLPRVSSLQRFEYPDPAAAILALFEDDAELAEIRSQDEFRTPRTRGGFSLASSIKCLSDTVRTRRFTDGIVSIMAVLRERFPDEELHVLEAGGGAIPFMSLVAAISDSGAKITVLEINPVSAAYAERVIMLLGLSNRIKVIRCDARTYIPAVALHLLISETIDSGLMREPIVQILNKLAPSVREGGVIVPELIRIECGIAPFEVLEGVEEGAVLPYGVFIPAVPDSIFTKQIVWRTDRLLRELSFPLPGDHGEDDAVVLRMWITIASSDAGSIQLSPRESAITMPLWYPIPLSATSRYRYLPGAA